MNFGNARNLPMTEIESAKSATLNVPEPSIRERPPMFGKIRSLWDLLGGHVTKQSLKPATSTKIGQVRS
jgi:hypothetical protein